MKKPIAPARLRSSRFIGTWVWVLKYQYPVSGSEVGMCLRDLRHKICVQEDGLILKAIRIAAST